MIDETATVPLMMQSSIEVIGCVGTFILDCRVMDGYSTDEKAIYCFIEFFSDSSLYWDGTVNEALTLENGIYPYQPKTASRQSHFGE